MRTFFLDEMLYVSMPAMDKAKLHESIDRLLDADGPFAGPWDVQTVDTSRPWANSEKRTAGRHLIITICCTLGEDIP